jgi:hypothetical protein
MIITNNELDIILGICGATIGFLAFSNEFPDKKYYGTIKSLEFKLIVFVLATFVGVWATLKKNSLADIEKANEKLNSQKEQRKNDSANRILTDQSNTKIIQTFTSALAEYGLKYDSSERVVLKAVRDSSKKVVEKTSPINPSLDICNIKKDSVENGITKFLLSLCASKSTAYNINLKLYEAVVVDEQYFLVGGPNEFYPKNGTLAVDKTFTWGSNFVNLSNQTSRIEFLFIGSYTNENKKPFPLNLMYEYDFNDKKWGMDTEPNYSKTVDFFHYQGLKF